MNPINRSAFHAGGGEESDLKETDDKFLEPSFFAGG
jgi:hypothetical protein